MWTVTGPGWGQEPGGHWGMDSTTFGSRQRTPWHLPADCQPAPEKQEPGRRRGWDAVGQSSSGWTQGHRRLPQESNQQLGDQQQHICNWTFGKQELPKENKSGTRNHLGDKSNNKEIRTLQYSRLPYYRPDTFVQICSHVGLIGPVSVTFYEGMSLIASMPFCKILPSF